MIYECEKCGTALRAGDYDCAGCGDSFETPVPGETAGEAADVAALAPSAPLPEPPVVNKRRRGLPRINIIGAAAVLLGLLGVSAGLSYRWWSSAGSPPATAASSAAVPPPTTDPAMSLPSLAAPEAAKPGSRADRRRARRLAARLAARERAKRKRAALPSATVSPAFFSPDETRYWQTLRGQAMRLTTCEGRFSNLCHRPDFDGAGWQAGMQGVGAELRALTAEGDALPEPPQFEGAGQEYHLAMTDCDYVASLLPGVLEQRDGETLRGYVRYVQDARGHLQRAQALLVSLQGTAGKDLKGGAG